MPLPSPYSACGSSRVCLDFIWTSVNFSKAPCTKLLKLWIATEAVEHLRDNSISGSHEGCMRVSQGAASALDRISVHGDSGETGRSAAQPQCSIPILRAL
ncbi:hypothetical protein PM082_009444 [Marasmius tenuissimus]|nr:hypothetical protein PM082_009444 [Marasmius tenuissimus]